MSGSYRFNCFSDNGAPGLLKYGLHNELLSSDSEDTDYKPGSASPSDVSSSSEEEMFVVKSKKLLAAKRRCFLKRKRKRKQSESLKKRRNVLYDSTTTNSNESHEADNGKNPYETRGQETKRIEREKSFPQHECDPHNNTWSSLPTEIIALIFSHVLSLEKGVRYLSRCAQVCQTWSNVASQPISWQGTVDLAFIGKKKVANDTLLASLASTKITEITGLNLHGWIHVTSNGISSIAENCPRLEYLNISNCQRNISKITGDNIVDLAENTCLKKVDFSNLRVCTGYSMSIVKFIKIRGEHLTHLNLSENVSLGSAVATCICENCPNLVVLNLSNTSVRSICFLALQRTCSKLQELYLANLALEIKHFSNDDDDNNNNRNKEEENTLGFPNLKILSVAKSNHIGWFTDKLIKTILRTSDILHTLDIRGNRTITDKGLDITSNKIERLFLSHTNISLKTIELICHKWKDILWDLDLSRAEAYGTQFDVLIRYLVANEAEPCCKLRNLNLAGTAITDSGVEIILSHCTMLNSLDLTSCRGISRGNKRFHNGSEAIENLRECYRNISSDG